MQTHRVLPDPSGNPCATQHQWVALLGFSSAALKWPHGISGLAGSSDCNSRFLILPPWHYPNLASRVLSRSGDSPRRRCLTIPYCYWKPLSTRPASPALCTVQPLGLLSTDRYQPDSSPKRIFVYPATPCPTAVVTTHSQSGATHRMLTADQMRTPITRTAPSTVNHSGYRHRGDFVWSGRLQR